MTKYEEMPPNTALTEIANGDRLTLTQPREGESLALFACEHRNGRMGVILVDEFVALGDLLRKRLKITKIERPIPEVELPTVPGYYEAAQFPLSKGWPYILSLHGQWYGNGGKVTEEQMRSLMPLTRLVPETEAAPAKLADRLDVEKLVDLLRRNASSITGYYRDAEALVAAIDNGELDK